MGPATDEMEGEVEGSTLKEEVVGVWAEVDIVELKDIGGTSEVVDVGRLDD